MVTSILLWNTFISLLLDLVHFRHDLLTPCSNRYEFGLLDGPAYRCLTLQEQATLAGSWVHHAIVHYGTSVSYYLNGALSINTWLLNYSGLNLATNKFTFGGGTNNWDFTSLPKVTCQ